METRWCKDCLHEYTDYSTHPCSICAPGLLSADSPHCYEPRVNKVIPVKVTVEPLKVTSDGSTASYYELPEGAQELQDLISYRNMNSQIGEIFRACYRYGIVSHSDMLRDAKKIKFYAEAEIKRLEKLEISQK